MSQILLPASILVRTEGLEAERAFAVRFNSYMTSSLVYDRIRQRLSIEKVQK